MQTHEQLTTDDMWTQQFNMSLYLRLSKIILSYLSVPVQIKIYKLKHMKQERRMAREHISSPLTLSQVSKTHNCVSCLGYFAWPNQNPLVQTQGQWITYEHNSSSWTFVWEYKKSDYYIWCTLSVPVQIKIYTSSNAWTKDDGWQVNTTVHHETFSQVSKTHICISCLSYFFLTKLKSLRSNAWTKDDGWQFNKQFILSLCLRLQEHRKRRIIRPVC